MKIIIIYFINLKAGLEYNNSWAHLEISSDLLDTPLFSKQRNLFIEF